MSAVAAPVEVVLVTGISGSGKSVALHALEDSGFFCVDNLPPELLREFLRLEATRGTDRRIAIAVDVRSAGSLPHLLPLLAALHTEGVAVKAIFLDATTDALLRRFSETRRPHPLSDTPGEPADDGIAGRRGLVDAIELERELLAELRELSTVIDTSQLRPVQLRAWMRELVSAGTSRLTLVFESFAYKNGVPLDADFVFDVRVLPNPHYIRELKPLNGRDDAVAAYLDAQPEVAEMLGQIEVFLGRWLPSFEADQRSYLTVAIGCTGGQHRSVWFVERLAERFAARVATLIRHREVGVDPERAAAMTVHAALPLFPLGTVLYPEGLLVLKIFEARYLDLMSRCMRDASAFGVVALKQGGEVGRAAEGEAIELHGTGTLAHLIDVDAPAAGILHVRCRGGRRFDVAAPHQQADGLWLGDATERPDAPVVEPGPACAHLARSLEDAVAALAAKGAAPFLEPHRFESAGWIADRWCELLPLAVQAKQLLLEQDDPLKRIAIVESLLQRMRAA